MLGENCQNHLSIWIIHVFYLGGSSNLNIKTRMHSSRMRTDCSLSVEGLYERDPSRRRPPWTETTQTKTPWTETPWTGTRRTETPKRETPWTETPWTDPLDRDPLDRDPQDRDPQDRGPLSSYNSKFCENILGIHRAIDIVWCTGRDRFVRVNRDFFRNKHSCH